MSLKNLITIFSILVLTACGGGGGGGGFGQYPDTNAPFNVGASGSSGIVVLKITE